MILFGYLIAALAGTKNNRVTRADYRLSILSIFRI